MFLISGVFRFTDFWTILSFTYTVFVIRSRRLFKRALYVGRDLVDMPRLTRLDASSYRRLHAEIAETAGVELHAVILDIPPLRKDMQMQVKVKSMHDYVPFEDLVPLLPLMNASHFPFATFLKSSNGVNTLIRYGLL